MSIVPPCPKCASSNTHLNKKLQKYVCEEEECKHVFLPEKEQPHLRIFISYGRDEYASLAKRLKNDLIKRGHDVWFDSERLKEGGDWEQYIDEGLNHVAKDITTGRVVYIMTPHSTRRPEGYCLNELARALSKSLPIVPLMLVYCEPPLSICRLQYLDMQDSYPPDERGVAYDQRFERLLSALEENKIDFEGFQGRLLAALEPIKFQADIEMLLRNFIGRKWVIEEIDKWYADPDGSKIFWLTGAPGTGKSAVAAWIRDNRREIAAYHFCDINSEEKRNASRLVRSISYQLSTQLPHYEEKLKSLHVQEIVNEYHESYTLFDRLIVQPLSENFPNPGRTVVVLIDALDEATYKGYNALASFIATEFKKTPDWLRLIITSRPERAVTGPLQALKSFELDTDSEANRDDLRNYLHRSLALLVQGRTDAGRIVEYILSRSEGVFLYVERVCDDLHRGNLSLDRLDQFPRGLGEVFLQYFNRMIWIDDKDNSRPDYECYKKTFRPALRTIIAAQEPLPIEILQRLFGWEQEELRDFTRSLGSLFPVLTNDGHEVIKPYHKSLLDWLVDEPKSGEFFVSEEEGHKLLAEYSNNEYNLGVSKMSEYSLRYILLHLYKSGDDVRAKQLAGDRLFIEARRNIGLRSVFISHALDCEGMDLVLAENLTSNGHQVQFQNLAPGDDWESSINQALDDADTFLVLLTPNAVRRPDGYCLNEIARAMHRGLQIIPIMVRHCDPPLSICRIQWLDMRDYKSGQTIDSLKLKLLIKAIEKGELDFEIKTQTRLISELHPFDFSVIISKHLKLFTDHHKHFVGRQDIINVVQQWLEPPKDDEPTKTRVFWISGGPGVGKTALSAMLCSRFSEIAAIHFCDFCREDVKDPRRVIKSIAYQLSTQLTEYEKHLNGMDVEKLYHSDASTLFDILLVQPLTTLKPPKRSFVILIDALDEATRDGGHNELASLIEHKFTKTPAWLRLIITSRPERTVIGHLQALAPFVRNIEPEDNLAEVRDYVQRELRPFLQERPDVDRIVENIIDRSRGMFLYAEVICHYIQSGRLSLDRLDLFRDMRDHLHNFGVPSPVVEPTRSDGKDQTGLAPALRPGQG